MVKRSACSKAASLRQVIQDARASVYAEPVCHLGKKVYNTWALAGASVARFIKHNKGELGFMEEKQETAIAEMEGGANLAEDQHPMQALIDEGYTVPEIKQGEIVKGTIVSISPTEILVDVGTKSEGIVSGRELERLGSQRLSELEPGSSIWVYIVRPEDKHGNLVLSIRRAEMEHDWQRALELNEAGDMFEEEVAGFNKGGLIVRLGRLRGFVPASQLAPQHQGDGNQPPEQRWSRLVGQTVHLKVIEVDQRRRRLILSEQAAVRSWREEQKERLLQELRVGEVRKGVVASLTHFGAFVDLGGADGLIHVSELSWRRNVKPQEIVRVGQEVDVHVLNVDPERKRIALSLKRLEPEPWSVVDERYYVGQLVEGQITKLTDFGAFALINNEIEGMVHVSELSPGRVNHPREVVQEGQSCTLRIIRIDSKRRRMGLSLKRVADPEYAEMDWRAELAAAESELNYQDKDDEYEYEAEEQDLGEPEVDTAEE